MEYTVLHGVSSQKNCFFLDAGSISDCVAVSGRIIFELVMNWEGFGRKKLWPNEATVIAFCLAGRRITKKQPQQYC